MVKVVTPAATRTTPEMINIFFSFMGRRYPPPLSTSYVERSAEVPGLMLRLLVFKGRAAARTLPEFGLEDSRQTLLPDPDRQQVTEIRCSTANTGYRCPPSSGI